MIIESKIPDKVKLKAALESNNADELRDLFIESRNTTMYVRYEKSEVPFSGGKCILGDKGTTKEQRYNTYVLINLCKNPNTPRDILESLVEMGYWMMYNESFCPNDLKDKIEILWNDPNNRKGVYITPSYFRNIICN